MSTDPHYEPPTTAERRVRGALARSLASHKRRRGMLLVTTIVTMVGVGAALFIVPIGLRQGPPSPDTRPAPPAPPAPLASDERPAPNDDTSPLEVTVRGNVVLLGGVEVARTDGIAEAGRPQKVEGLYLALKKQRFDHPGDTRKITLTIATDVPALVVKSVFQTATFAGYRDIQFVVPSPDAGTPPEAGAP